MDVILGGAFVRPRCSHDLFLRRDPHTASYVAVIYTGVIFSRDVVRGF